MKWFAISVDANNVFNVGLNQMLEQISCIFCPSTNKRVVLLRHYIIKAYRRRPTRRFTEAGS